MKLFFLIETGLLAICSITYVAKYGYNKYEDSEISKDDYQWVAYWESRSQQVTDKAKEFLVDNKISVREKNILENAYEDTELYVLKQRCGAK